MRVGPSQRIANESEERILTERRTARARPFDARPCKGCGLADLAGQDLFLVTHRRHAIAREVVEENNRDLKEQLASLRFYDLRADCPTNAGVLLFAQDPLRFIPGAYVHFVLYQGLTATSEPVNEKQLSGDLISVLRELDNFLPLQINERPVPASALSETRVTTTPSSPSVNS